MVDLKLRIAIFLFTGNIQSIISILKYLKNMYNQSYLFFHTTLVYTLLQQNQLVSTPHS